MLIKRRVHLLHIGFILSSITFMLLMPLKSVREKEMLKVRIVQLNEKSIVSPEELKLKSKKEITEVYVDDIKKQINRYMEQTTKDWDHDIDLVVWPESAYPLNLSLAHLDDEANEATRIVKGIISRIKRDFIFGGTSIESKTSVNSIYVTGFYYSASGKFQESYNKQVLFPIGERSFFSSGTISTEINKDNVHYTVFRGDSFPLFELEKYETNLLPIICSEMIFSRYIGEYLRGLDSKASAIINLTNDFNFLDTSGPLQHLFLARWRAVEYNLPIIRAAATGISTIIYPDGSLGKKAGFNKKYNLDISLKEYDQYKTIYERFGIFSFILLLLLLVILEFKWRKL
jgi:apolipoprotein N-acyltransferase